MCQAMPSASAAFSSPTRHLLDLTNWKTPTGQSCAQPRSISPKAAVDLPLPSPVWTISRGFARRARVVRPSVGHRLDLALRHQAALPVNDCTRPASGAAARSRDAQAGRVEVAGEVARQPEPHDAVLGVDDHRGDLRTGQPRRRSPGSVDRRRATRRRLAVGHDDQQRTAARVPYPLDRRAGRRSGSALRPAEYGRRSAARSCGERLRRRDEVGGSTSVASWPRKTTRPTLSRRW